MNIQYLLVAQFGRFKDKSSLTKDDLYKLFQAALRIGCEDICKEISLKILEDHSIDDLMLNNMFDGLSQKFQSLLIGDEESPISSKIISHPRTTSNTIKKYFLLFQIVKIKIDSR